MQTIAVPALLARRDSLDESHSLRSHWRVILLGDPELASFLALNPIDVSFAGARDAPRLRRRRPAANHLRGRRVVVGVLAPGAAEQRSAAAARAEVQTLVWLERGGIAQSPEWSPSSAVWVHVGRGAVGDDVRIWNTWHPESSTRSHGTNALRTVVDCNR